MTPVEAVNALDSAASMDFEMPAPGTPGYDEFRKTGKLPSVEDSASSKEEVETPVVEAEEIESLEEEESAPSTESAVTRAESAPAPPQRGKGDANARIRQLVASQNKDRELIRQLTEKLTGPQSVQPRSQTAAEPEAKPAAQVAVKPKPKIDDLDAQGKPAFKTYGEYEDARDEYNRGELMRLFEDKQTKSQQQQGIVEAEKVVNQVWGQRITEARKAHADYDTVVKAAVEAKDDLGRDLFFLPKGSAPDSFLLDSDLGSEVLYYIGQHVDEAKHIFERNPEGAFVMNPIRQVRELAKIENMIEQSRTALKPALPKPPARPVTQAPPPAHQVSGKGPSPDPLQKAVEDGDQRAYTDAQNAKALASFKSRRR